MLESGLTAFVAGLYTEGLTAGTAKSYLAAVRHAQIAIGLGDPHMSNMPQLEYVIKGMRKKTARAPQRTRLPVTPAIMLQLKKAWARMSITNRMQQCCGRHHACASSAF